MRVARLDERRTTNDERRTLPPFVVHLIHVDFARQVVCYNAAARPTFARCLYQKERAVIHSPRIQIHYCTQCRWLLRAAWFAQELLTTFETELGEVALVPGTGGIFAVYVDATPIWSRAEQGRFPDIKELKQLVRDQIAPGRSLGHTDKAHQPIEP